MLEEMTNIPETNKVCCKFVHVCTNYNIPLQGNINEMLQVTMICLTYSMYNKAMHLQTNSSLSSNPHLAFSQIGGTSGVLNVGHT
jgi:hypothetical protein